MTCVLAAENGHLEPLKWELSNSRPLDEETYQEGQCHGDPALLGYFEEKGCPV